MMHTVCEHGQYPYCQRCDEQEKTVLLVQQASRPTLDELYKKARAKGLILKKSAYN